MAFGLVAGAVVGLLATGAGAHTDLLQGSPGPGQRVGGTVDFVDLVFASPVTEVVVTLTGPDGEEIPGQTVVSDGQIIRFEMAPLEMLGRYVVSWEMVSTDGDLTTSNYFFDIETDGFEPTRIGDAAAVAVAHDDSADPLARAILIVAVGALAAVCVALVVLLLRRRAALASVREGRDQPRI